MRLHTRLTPAEVNTALATAKIKGLIAWDVDFAVWAPGRSLTHPHAYDIQLGASDKHSLPPGYTDQNGRHQRVRRSRNSGYGERRHAATWHEWGWLIAEIFAADPGARWGADPARSARPEYAGGYSSPEDFRAKTRGEFEIPAGQETRS